MTDNLDSPLVKRVDDLAKLLGLDVGQVHEMHKAVSENALRLRLPERTEQPNVDAPPVGLSASTGKRLEGWPYVEQYIEKVLTTRIGSRVMRRHLGTQVPEIQDAPGIEAVIVQVFRSIAEALDKYVPWYRLSEITLADAGRDGAYLFLLTGTYYPNAHKGDFSTTQERLARVLIGNGDSI